jgi:hypothetical protein
VIGLESRAGIELNAGGWYIVDRSGYAYRRYPRKTEAGTQQAGDSIFVGIDVPAKLIPGVAAAYQKGAVLSDRQIEQETSPKWDIRHLLAIRSFGRYKASLGLQLEIAHRKEAQPDSAAAGSVLETNTLLEITGLRERPKLDTGPLRGRR